MTEEITLENILQDGIGMHISLNQQNNQNQKQKIKKIQMNKKYTNVIILHVEKYF